MAHKVEGRRLVRTAHRYSDRKDVRMGDWICPYCSNHNFSFRQVCNRCQLKQDYTKVDQRLMLRKISSCSSQSSEASLHSIFPKAVLLSTCQDNPETTTVIDDVEAQSNTKWVSDLLLDQ